MFTLYTFYKSREWEGLLKIIKQERVNADGYLICEQCGRPMLKAYDVIGHHKVELTEQNVNDRMISLNPDNIALVHHACHNRIHDKLAKLTRARQVFLVYGAPLSGKTTWVQDNKGDDDYVVDMDNIWQCITGGKRYYKPNRLKAIAFKIRDAELDAVKYRLGKWSQCYVTGGYPLQSERERLAQELGAREIFIDASKEECLKRLESLPDDDGRNKEEWRGYIEEWFRRFNPAPVD